MPFARALSPCRARYRIPVFPSGDNGNTPQTTRPLPCSRRQQGIYLKFLKVWTQSIPATSLRGTASDYQWLFAAAEEPVLIVDTSTECIVEANPSALRIVADNRSSVIGAHFTTCFSADSCARLRAGLQIAHVQQRAASVDVCVHGGQAALMAQVSVFRTEAQSYFLIRLAPTDARPADGQGATRSIVFSAIDQALFGFVMTDTAFRIDYANGAFAAMVGQHTHKDVLGSPLGRWVTLTSGDIVGLRSQLAQRLASTQLTTTLRSETRPSVHVAIDAICVPAGIDSSWGFIVNAAAALH